MKFKIFKYFVWLICLTYYSNIFLTPSYEKIWELHSASYPTKTIEEIELDNKNLTEKYLLPKLTQKEQIETAFTILGLADKLIPESAYNSDIIDDSAWKDFNFFYGTPKYPQKHILNKMNKTKTNLGYGRLAKQLTNTSSSVSELRKRQLIIDSFASSSGLTKFIDQELNNFAQIEPVFEVLFNSNYQSLFSAMFNSLYINFLPKNINQKVNSNSKIMQWFFIWNLISVIPTSIVGINQLILISRNARTIANSANLADATNGYYKFISATISIHKLFLSAKNILGQQLLAVSKLIKTALNLEEIISSHHYLKNLPAIQNISKIFRTPSESMKTLLSILQKENLNYGDTLVAFRIIPEIKNELAILAAAIAEIDMYRSLALLYEESQNTKNKFCFPKYIEINKPYIDINGVWNILFDQNSAISNNIKLGAATNNIGYNMILTGPNESGKSGFQKAMVISLIMAQTVAITSANSCEIQLFDDIKYYQNPTDNSIEGKSLFRVQAEQFNKLFNINPNIISYISLDEPTTGANAEICSAILLSAAQNLQNNLCATCVLSTHYPIITNLEPITNRFFKNYKFSIVKDINNKILYKYKLEEGISDQHIELDIMQREGLNKDILNKAILLLKNKNSLLQAKL